MKDQKDPPMLREIERTRFKKMLKLKKSDGVMVGFRVKEEPIQRAVARHSSVSPLSPLHSAPQTSTPLHKNENREKASTILQCRPTSCSSQHLWYLPEQPSLLTGLLLRLYILKNNTVLEEPRPGLDRLVLSGTCILIPPELSPRSCVLAVFSLSCWQLRPLQLSHLLTQKNHFCQSADLQQILKLGIITLCRTAPPPPRGDPCPLLLFILIRMPIQQIILITTPLRHLLPMIMPQDGGKTVTWVGTILPKE